MYGSRGFRVIVWIGLAACGSKASNKVPDAAPPAADAPPPTPDAPPDSPPPPDAPSYDFACYGETAPTTADDPVTVAGTTDTLSMTGSMQPVPSVALTTYKSGDATPLDATTSDATTGAFTTGNLTTGGTPLDGYLEGSKATYRTTYLYPPTPLAKSLAMIPVPMISTSTFNTLTTLASVTQDDAKNGVLVLEVTDCSLKGISGATLSVTQNGASVGQSFDAGSYLPQLAGLFIVFNVPDGPTSISANYSGMNFPAHTVMAHKAPADAGSVGTITSSAVVPGP